MESMDIFKKQTIGQDVFTGKVGGISNSFAVKFLRIKNNPDYAWALMRREQRHFNMIKNLQHPNIV